MESDVHYCGLFASFVYGFGSVWFKWARRINLQKSLLFVPLLIVLGFANIAFGEKFLSNLKGMGIFLLPAVGAFTTSLLIMKTSWKIVL